MIIFCNSLYYKELASQNIFKKEKKKEKLTHLVRKISWPFQSDAIPQKQPNIGSK
jgi:hypothetical protein